MNSSVCLKVRNEEGTDGVTVNYAGNVAAQKVAYTIHPVERRARAFQPRGYRLVLLEERVAAAQ